MRVYILDTIRNPSHILFTMFGGNNLCTTVPCFYATRKKCVHKININQICSELNTDKQQHNSQVNEKREMSGRPLGFAGVHCTLYRDVAGLTFWRSTLLDRQCHASMSSDSVQQYEFASLQLCTSWVSPSLSLSLVFAHPYRYLYNIYAE